LLSGDRADGGHQSAAQTFFTQLAVIITTPRTSMLHVLYKFAPAFVAADAFSTCIQQNKNSIFQDCSISTKRPSTKDLHAHASFG
jgi:hypothetical protein